MSLVKWIDFQSLGDERGGLVSVEIGMDKAVPFDIKRVYYIYHTDSGVSRGYHAHKSLKQVAICVAGKCRMVLNDGTSRDEVWLDSPTKGLVFEVWFGGKCMILAKTACCWCWPVSIMMSQTTFVSIVNLWS